MATDTAASPRPAMIWVISPPNECPMTAGFWSKLSDDVGEVVGHLLDGHVGEHFRMRVGLVHRLRLVRPAGSERRVARLFEDLPPTGPSWRAAATGRG